MRQFRFSPALPETPPFTIGDGLILLGTASALYAGLRVAFNLPVIIRGPDISLSPLALPWYALLSVGRMAAAYFLSLLFSLFYGYAAARNRTARTVLRDWRRETQAFIKLALAREARRTSQVELLGG